MQEPAVVLEVVAVAVAVARTLAPGDLAAQPVAAACLHCHYLFQRKCHCRRRREVLRPGPHDQP